MNENEFVRLADETIAALESAIEDCGTDCDLDPVADGILKLRFPDGSQIIINRHTAAREIWIASRSGGFHYQWNGVEWRDVRTGDDLTSALERLIEEQGGGRVSLA